MSNNLSDKEIALELTKMIVDLTRENISGKDPELLTGLEKDLKTIPEHFTLKVFENALQVVTSSNSQN